MTTPPHPAGDHIGVTKRALWYGLEVEGPQCLGRPTAFLDAWPGPDDLRDILGRIDWAEVTHIFLTENFEAFDQFEEALLSACVGGQVAITIGTFPHRVERLLNLYWIRSARLMVRANMEARWIRMLRKDDQVSVGLPYDLVTWSVDSGVRSVPEDYAGDKA